MSEAVHPVLAAAATYRAQLLRQEDAAVRRMVAAYGTAYQRMGAQIRALQDALDGRPMTFAQATRVSALQALRQQIETEIGRFGVVADNELTQTARQAIQTGLNHATGLVEAYFASEQARGALRASFTQLQPAQVETMVGFLAPNSPLHDSLTAQLGPAVAESVSSRLIDGMIRGFNPNKTAGIVRRELGVGLAWAVNTTRTANLWAYREATRANYAANPRVVSGWTWLATLDGRVCGNCLSQHGSRHSLTETLNGHHQCRCVPIPELPLAKSLGLDLPEIEPGEAWFRRQPESLQQGILGPGMWAAWKDGAVSFADFRGHTYDHPVYGAMQRMPTMAQLGLERYHTRGERAAESRTPVAVVTKPVGPAGRPVGESLRLPKRGDIVQTFRDAIAIIDSVHGDGDLPNLPVKAGPLQNGMGAYYKLLPATGKPIEIKVSTLYEMPATALIHEIGHFLDFAAIQKSDDQRVTDSLDSFRQAASNTRALRTIEAQRNAPNADQRYLNYLQMDVEVWARAYTQYIATRSGNALLNSEIEVMRNWPIAMQWQDDDFVPVATAIDELFTALGWRR